MVAVRVSGGCCPSGAIALSGDQKQNHKGKESPGSPSSSDIADIGRTKPLTTKDTKEHEGQTTEVTEDHGENREARTRFETHACLYIFEISTAGIFLPAVGSLASLGM
jgi:hypothetical protein